MAETATEFSGQAVLVTGGGGGIGRAIGYAFALGGASVHLLDRDAGAAQLAADEFVDLGLAARGWAMDVTDEASVEAVMAEIAAAGGIDVLVNNAGIERTGSVEEMHVSAFRDVMETNCFGAIRCIQAVLPSMRARRSGCIANVTSISGKLASSPMGAYSASKFALEAVSECLAQEVKPFGIRVCVVEPGIIDTDMARHISVAGDASVYPNQRRMAAMFTAALQQPVPPSLVADKLVAIADGGSWQFRHPVGPDAAPFLQWRASLSDEA